MIDFREKESRTSIGRLFFLEKARETKSCGGNAAGVFFSFLEATNTEACLRVKKEKTIMSGF